MTTPTCAVRARILSPAGEPLAAARITARLNRPDVAMAAGYVAPAIVTATTDTAGLAVLDLWPNAIGATASQYLVDIITPAGDYWRVTATVPDAATADLEIIAALPAYPGKSDQQVALEAVQHYAAQAGESAVDAAGSAAAASGHADNAASSRSASDAAAANAASAATSAQTAAAAASASAGSALTHQQAAAVSASAADQSAQAAQASATAANGSADAAADAQESATAQADAAAASAATAQSAAAASAASAEIAPVVMVGVATSLIRLEAIFATHLNNT